MTRILQILLCASLAGCATTSFAPPGVSVQRVDTGRRASGDCVASKQGAVIPHNVLGAQKLIDNFVDAYRCAAHSAANGRQLFEVPSFLALVGSATAVALGAGSDVAILANAANGTLTGAKSYYVPQEKAAVLDHALDALLCIKTESVEVNAYSIGTIGQAQRMQFFAADGGGSIVTIPVDEQYFNMISAAVLSVERVMAQRLSKLGTPFDAAGIAAQIKTHAEETRKAEAEREAQRSAGFRTSGLLSANDVTLELQVMQPRLQDCVVRAKM